jgi:hypothetical protein
MTTMTKAQIEAERVLENRRIAFTKRVHNLLGHVGRRTSQKLIDVRFYALSDAERVEYGPKADALAAELASAEPVGRALHPAKARAVQSAREKAVAKVAQLRKDLEAAGWDIRVAAPVPTNVWAHDYKAARARRSVYESVTKSVDSSYSRSGPRIVEMDQNGIDRFISNTEQDAALQYDMFICKMVSKVGDVKDAQIEGDHVWSHSILTVTLQDGTVQRWKTQQIVNYSVYGTPYLQWPSRVVK